MAIDRINDYLVFDVGFAEQMTAVFERDLRDATEFSYAMSVPCTRLRRDARTDVLVVGMGISGAMIAEPLTAAGFRVVVLDRRGPESQVRPACGPASPGPIGVSWPRQ